MKLTVSNVTKSYLTRDHSARELLALNNASFSVEAGQFLAIVGESGSGKSTLAQIVTGLIPASKGTVTLDGMEISPRSRNQNKSISARIQLVLQDGKSALDPHFTVYKCIAEPLRNLCRLSREEEKARIHELMRQMELPEALLSRKPHELSGGQQKRVCIARALASRPEVIIFDEAISGLDVILRKSILDLLKRIHKGTKCTMLFITHDIDVALYMADRIIVMKDGCIVEDAFSSGDPSCLTSAYARTLVNAMLPNADILAEKA